ncbi:MAG: hypothetical protein AB2L07_11720 [Thermoanaerobaculaceae bacterium]
MFGAPDLVPESDLERLEERLAELPEAGDEELPWPLGRDTRNTFFLNERISPTAWQWRDGSVWLAVVVSLFFHLLVLSQLIRGSALQSMVAALEVEPRPRFDEEVPAFFEMVDMPDQKQETPSRRNAPGLRHGPPLARRRGCPRPTAPARRATPRSCVWSGPAPGAAGGSAAAGGYQVAGKGTEGEGEGKGSQTGRGEGSEPPNRPQP